VAGVADQSTPAVVDIDAVSEVAHSRGAKVCVDNTFATPFLQQPLRLGADLVVHSSTKYIGGHSDVVGGAIMTNDDELEQRLRFHQNAVRCGSITFRLLAAVAWDQRPSRCASSDIVQTPWMSHVRSNGTKP